MKKRSSPIIVGMFVVGFLVLGAAAIIGFGGKNLFGDRVRFVVVAENTSISGLDAGAAVKLSGVRVGRVESVNIVVDPESAEFSVRIVCDLDDANAVKDPERTERLIERLVEGGLQAGLKFAGVTGLLYLDLEMKKIDEKQVMHIDPETGAPIVPLATSIFEEYIDTFEKIVTGLASVDFEGISERSKTLLDNLNTTVLEADVPRALRTIERSAESLTALAEGEEVKTAVQSFAEAAAALEKTLSAMHEAGPELRENLDVLLADVAATLHVFSDAGIEVRDLVGARGGLPTELGRTLGSIQNAAESLTNLIDFLERNPGALVRGRAVEGATNPRE